MSVEQMRGYLKQLYHACHTWRTKVDRMPDKQVVAVYMRFKEKKG